MKNEEIFDVLRTKGTELSDWLKENFNPHTAIIITDTEVKIVEDKFGLPTKKVI